VDAGGPTDPVLDLVRRHRIRVTHLLNTHHHSDHTCGNGTLRRATGARLLAHRLEAPRIDGLDATLEDDERFETGDLSVRVLHIPGHTAGQAAFVVSRIDDADGRGDAGEPAVCFTGDTLFRASVGSTTAPGHTTFADLRRSLVDRCWLCPMGPRGARPRRADHHRRASAIVPARHARRANREAERRRAMAAQVHSSRDYDPVATRSPEMRDRERGRYHLPYQVRVEERRGSRAPWRSSRDPPPMNSRTAPVPRTRHCATRRQFGRLGETRAPPEPERQRERAARPARLARTAIGPPRDGETGDRADLRWRRHRAPAWSAISACQAVIFMPGNDRGAQDLHPRGDRLV
jgi:glyoxylase-like metal-dependent hydrolase (beta-lactamase superfamily II)